MQKTLITDLELGQFRNHQRQKVSFSDNISVITGINGSGKTSILEAIYILLRGSSFRGSDAEIVKSGEAAYRLKANLQDQERLVHYYQDRAKQFSIDGVKSKRLPAKAKYPVVLFEPNDLQLINGSPARRRRYLDRFISGYDGQYQTWLSRYERSLRQRNSLLKKPSKDRQDLFAWDVLLSDYGAKIIKARLEAIELINQRVNQAYQQIARQPDEIKIAYSNPDDTTTEAIHRSLDRVYGYDSLSGSTSVGPHRHDLVVNFNHSLAASSASRGEARSIVISLKLLEANILLDKTNLAPIILLDDVFSELDNQRQLQLLNSLQDWQIILTSATLPTSLKKTDNFKLIKLSA